MNTIFLIGRILFAVLFLFSAVGHLSQTAAMTGYSKSKGVPFPQLAVIASGVLFCLGALSVLLGVWGDLGALVLAAVLIPTCFFMHAFWKETDAMAKQTEMTTFIKNVALMGGALAFFVAFQVVRGLAITGPLFNLHIS